MINGQLQDLPATDSLLGAGGAAAWVNTTLTLPNGRGVIEATQNIVDAACLATSTIVLKLAATTSADENEAEGIALLSLVANPNIGSFDISATFADLHSGPIMLQYQIN